MKPRKFGCHFGADYYACLVMDLPQSKRSEMLSHDVSRNLHIVPKSKYWNNKITIDTIFYCSDNNFSYYRHQFSPAVTSCLSLCDGELFSLRRYLILNCGWVVDNNFEWQCDSRQSRCNRTIIMILI